MDIEKAMEFILEQNARHAAAIQQLDDQNARHAAAIQQLDERMARTEGMIRQLVDVSMSLARHAEGNEARIAKLVEETDRRFREREKSGAHTDRRLDALIDVVEKLTRRNGGTS